MSESSNFAAYRRSEHVRLLGVFPPVVKRRTFSPEEKARLVAESFASEESVCAFARRHQLAASQLFAWRKMARQDRGAGLHEVLPPRRHDGGGAPRSEAAARGPGSKPSQSLVAPMHDLGCGQSPWPDRADRRTAPIEITIGSAVVRVPRDVDRATLKLVLDTLLEA